MKYVRSFCWTIIYLIAYAVALGLFVGLILGFAWVVQHAYWVLWTLFGVVCFGLFWRQVHNDIKDD